MIKTATPPETDNAELAERSVEDEMAVAALLVLANSNIPPDVQELLVYGNPSRGVPPGALSACFKAALARRPAPRVSEEHIKQLLKQTLRARLEVTPQHGDRDIIHGAVVSEQSIHEAARYILSLFAGEALRPSTLAAEWVALGDTLDGLLDTYVVNAPDNRITESAIKELFWDNKVGIIRCLQGRGQPAPAEDKYRCTNWPGCGCGTYCELQHGKPAPAEAQESTSTRLMKAADAVKDDVCSLLCPSVWETDKGPPPHHHRCVELRAALSESIDEQSYADLRTSGGLPEAQEPPHQPTVTPDTARARAIAKRLLFWLTISETTHRDQDLVAAASAIRALASQVEALTAERDVARCARDILEQDHGDWLPNATGAKP